MPNNSKQSKRAALQKQRELEAQRARKQRMMIAVLAVVALIVVGIMGVVVWQNLNVDQANQQRPPHASAEDGIKVGDAEGVPNLVVYEDFQCSACAQYEAVFGPAIAELVKTGKITVEYRTVYFMDTNIGNDSSEKAAMAAAAADAVGKYAEYHEAAFKGQHAVTTGFTDEQLLVEFPAAADITGDDLTKFKQLYEEKAFQNFIEGTYDKYVKKNVGGTPAFFVGDERIEPAGTDGSLPGRTPEGMLKLIEGAAG